MFNRLYALVLTVLLTLPAWAEPADTFAIAIRSRIDTLLMDPMFERSHVGLYVYDLTAAQPLYDYGRRQTLRPASNMKVMTAVAALSQLGTDYSYQTRLYLSDVVDLPSEMPAADATPEQPQVLRRSATVILKGGMDPLIGNDDLHALAQSLRDIGITDIQRDIVLDATFKDTLMLGSGWCWDDDNVPLTPFLYLGKATGFEANFTKALQAAGIKFTGRYVRGRVPQSAQLVATRKHSIDQILQPMMKRSNNLYAESLFYQLAARGGKPGATHKDAAAKVAQLIKTVGHDPANYSVADGSGLSLYNYLSAELLVDVLRYAHRNEEVYAHLYPSLPIMGRDGTLGKRCIGTSAQDRVHAKTGTLRGVSSLSGYALAPNGHLLAFAIINQGVKTSAQGRAFQDRVCKAMTRPLDLSSVEPDGLPEASRCEDEEPDDSTAAPDTAAPGN